MKYIIYTFLISFLAVSCTYTSTEDLVDDLPLPPQVTYDGNVKEIIVNNCIGCHNSNNASGGLNLEGYQNTRQSTENGEVIDRITRNVGDPLLMPQNMQLPQTSINLIIQWETDGFLEN